MDNDGTRENDQGSSADMVGHELRQRVREIEERQDEASSGGPAAGYSYEMKLGRETIHLDAIEFRILRFLASQPYRAFTRRRIAEAVSTDRHPVAPEALDRHIGLLRNALGFFRDYIQTVPDIGYRFRA